MNSATYKTKYVLIPFKKIKQTNIFRWNKKWWQKDNVLKYWAYTVAQNGKFNPDKFECFSFVDVDSVGVKIKSLS